MKKGDTTQAFKLNDIRGEFPKEINKDLFYKIGRAFVTYFKSKNVILGYDMRISSPNLRKAFAKGVMDSGANIIDIGTVSTGVVYFASGFLKKSAAMITASHNPTKFNGIKFLKRGAVSINRLNGLEQIKKLVREDKFKTIKKKGKYIKKNILKEFKKHVLSFVDKNSLKSFKVVIDAGNGMAGKIVPIVYEGLPMKINPMYFKLDGRFPNHVPDPLTSKNNKEFLRKVKKTEADFGMSFDGDADRVFFADEKGNMLTSSISSCIFIKHLLKKYPKSKIVYNLVMSKVVLETIKKYGGKPILTKVGHSIIKNKMRETGALFGCEHSGHFYYKKSYATDSAIISSLVMYELLSKLELWEELSEMAKEFQKYHKTPEKNIKVKTQKEKHEKINRLEKYYKKQTGVKKINTFNGIRVEFDDFWFNIRPSDTEPYLRLDLEADTKEIMQKEIKKLVKRVKRI